MLRVVDPRTFGDDSLRVLRAIQFAARFEARLEPETFAICRAIPLDDLPAERIWGEVEKLLLQAERPSLGLQLALDLGIVERLWPELHALVGCEQDPEWHPEGDVWVHTLMVVDGARTRLEGLDRGRALTVMLGAVTHDFGKPATTAFIDGHIRSRGHEAAGVAPATAFLDRLNIHTVDGFDVRKHVLDDRLGSPGARHVAQVVDAGRRRRLPPPRRPRRSRAARPRRRGRLRRPHRPLRLLGDDVVPRARRSARRAARAAGADPPRPPPDRSRASSPARRWA